MSTKLETPAFWYRLIATFPLNGEPGLEIHILECDWPGLLDNFDQFYVVDAHGGGDPLLFATFGEAIRRCLNNNGWGTYRIEDIT